MQNKLNAYTIAIVAAFLVSAGSAAVQGGERVLYFGTEGAIMKSTMNGSCVGIFEKVRKNRNS